VVVGDKEEAVVLLVHVDKGLERPEIVADMEGARGLQARQ